MSPIIHAPYVADNLPGSGGGLQDDVYASSLWPICSTIIPTDGTLGSANQRMEEAISFNYKKPSFPICKILLSSLVLAGLDVLVTKGEVFPLESPK